jgi:hypothetical protein
VRTEAFTDMLLLGYLLTLIAALLLVELLQCLERLRFEEAVTLDGQTEWAANCLSSEM